MTGPLHGKTIIVAFFLQAVFSVTLSGELDLTNETTGLGSNESECLERLPRGEDGDGEFPKDLFSEEQLAQGAVLLHIVLAVYCFVGIARVCTGHFLPTIRCICQDLKVSDDVAAATFMSIATSAPELFTNIIGTFITETDIGVGHVLGNAYYDMFFVASVAGLATKKAIPLDWWPVTRDCAVYLVIASALTAVVWDGRVESYEALALFGLYILYFVVMFGNRRIIRFFRDKFGVDVVDSVRDDVLQNGDIKVKTIMDRMEADEDLEEALKDEEEAQKKGLAEDSTDDEDCSCRAVVRKALLQPLLFLLAITMPDVRKPTLRKFYPAVFVLCVAWIGVFTYLGTWMISVIGRTIGVPDSIMGLVFMAAGGSVVEVYAVFIKVRQGECSIGLSNSFGCNCMDVTLCLALPWLIKSLLALHRLGEGGVLLVSAGLHVNCALLVVSVLILYALFYINKFRLTKLLGGVCGVFYVIILSVAIKMLSQGAE